jgi:hypothetical protein
MKYEYRTVKLQAKLDHHDIAQAVDRAGAMGVLCPACTHNINFRSTMGHHSLCCACEAAISAVFKQEIMARIRTMLEKHGYAPDALKYEEQA